MSLRLLLFPHLTRFLFVLSATYVIAVCPVYGEYNSVTNGYPLLQTKLPRRVVANIEPCTKFSHNRDIPCIIVIASFFVCRTYGGFKMIAYRERWYCASVAWVMFNTLLRPLDVKDVWKIQFQKKVIVIRNTYIPVPCKSCGENWSSLSFSENDEHYVRWLLSLLYMMPRIMWQSLGIGQLMYKNRTILQYNFFVYNARLYWDIQL